jgi:protein arginine kinase activator
VVISGLSGPTELLQHFAVAGPTTRKPGAIRRLACAECGMTFAQFRRDGTLGCPACYESFGKHLSAMIERAQSGATHHCGKRPHNAGTSLDNQARMSTLMRELNSAVAAEQYERAAELRDTLAGLEQEQTDRCSNTARSSTEERRV